GDRVLDGDEVPGRDVHLLAPQDLAAGGREQLTAHPHALGGLDVGARKDVPDRELVSDLAGIDVLSRVARDVRGGADDQGAHKGQLVDHAVGQGELVEVGVGIAGQ